MRAFEMTALTALLLSCLLAGCSGDSGGGVAGTDGESSESSVPDQERVQGKWKIMGRGGKRGPRVTELTENPTAIEIVFEGDQYTHSKSDAKKFTLDPTASPKRITLNYMSGTSEEESFGIYKFEGDRLILCWQGVTEAYPESFRMNTSDDGRTIWSLQRISD